MAARKRKISPKNAEIDPESPEGRAKAAREAGRARPAPESLHPTRAIDMDRALDQYMGADGTNDPWIWRNMGVSIPKNWVPRMATKPVQVTVGNRGVLQVRKYSAAAREQFGAETEVDSEEVIHQGRLKVRRLGGKQKRIIWPKYYQNPYHFQDHIFFQDMAANTIAGRIIELLMVFVIANGIRPKLRVRYPGHYDSDEERLKVIERHKWLIEDLRQIENAVSIPQGARPFEPEPDTDIDAIGPMSTAMDPSVAAYETALSRKWSSAFLYGAQFGREMIVPRIDDRDSKVKVVRKGGEEVEFDNIPKIMILVHPRDMGFNYVDFDTHRLLGIQINNANWIIRPSEMIFWEWNSDNAIYGSKYYGMSMMQSMMGAARTLRKVIEWDFPLIASTRWAGMYWIVVKRKGEESGTSDAEITALLRNIKPDGINISLEENPTQDFVVNKIDLDPKISELLEMVRDLIKYIMAQVGLPEGLIYGEDGLNRDTLQKKITAWTRGPIKHYRSWFLDPITNQWYARLAATMAKQDAKWKEAMKEVEVYADVEEFKLEDPEAQIRVLQLLQNTVMKPFKDSAMAEYLGMDNLLAMIDPTKGKEDLPAVPQGRSSYSMTTQDGRRYGVQESG